MQGICRIGDCRKGTRENKRNQEEEATLELYSVARKGVYEEDEDQKKKTEETPKENSKSGE